jgi:signal transduction histidine kinase
MSRSDKVAADSTTPGRGRVWRSAALLAATVAISLGHYLTPAEHVHWHLVFQRLYYIPILLAAVTFGLWGGLAMAVVTAAFYLPHIVLHWGHVPVYRSEQLVEILMFLVIGALAGALVDRLREEREKQRRTAEELSEAYRQLQETFERLRLVDRLSALGALSAGLAHEIRTPLGSIAGAVEILESAVPAGDDRREFVAILGKEIERLTDLVNRQLDLVRAAPPERGPCDLEALVRSVLALAGKQAEKQGVAITLDVEPGLPTVQVDEGQVRQAVLNLVINAIQAMPEGGEIRLQVVRSGETVRLVVEDDGPGLGEDGFERVFEPFFTTKERGTGLGLSIAFQIANGHGGDLRAENRDRGGARFTMELPLAATGGAREGEGPV